MPQIPNCTDCKFFLASQHQGRPNVCRRFPPVMAADSESKTWITNFVIIAAPKDIWCGEYQKKLVLDA